MDRLRAEASPVNPARPSHAPENPPDRPAPPGPEGAAPPGPGPFRYADELTAHASRNRALKRHVLAKDILSQLATAAGAKGWCWRSLEGMARELNTKPFNVRRSLRTLEALGYVVMEMEPGQRCYTFRLPIDPGLRQRAGAGQGQSWAPQPAQRLTDARTGGPGTPSPTNVLTSPRKPAGGRGNRVHRDVGAALGSSPPPETDGRLSGLADRLREAFKDDPETPAGPPHERGGHPLMSEGRTPSWGSRDPLMGEGVTSKEPEREPETEPGRPGSVRPPVLTDDAPPPRAPAPAATPLPPKVARAQNALIDALAFAKPDAVNRAASLLSQAMDGHSRYLGGLRKLIWDATRLPVAVQAELVDLVERTSGRGGRFMREARRHVPRIRSGPAELATLIGPMAFPPTIGPPAPAPPASPTALGPDPAPPELDFLRRWWPKLTEGQRRWHRESGKIPAAMLPELRRLEACA